MKPNNKKKEINFTKYKKRGDYHWQGISNNIFSSNIFLQARYQMVLDRIPKLTKNKKVIDVGCGDGVLSYLIKIKKKGKIFGIDPSPEAIKIARKKFDELKIKDCSFKIGSGYNLPFRSNSFDFAVAADVIEHVNKPEKMLKEIRRILKKKGKIILSSTVKLSEIPEDKMHVREYLEDELKAMVKEYYYRVKTNTSHPLFLKNIYQSSFNLRRYKPQILRYLLNIFVNIFQINPFTWEIGPKLTCQTIVGYKK